MLTIYNRPKMLRFSPGGFETFHVQHSVSRNRSLYLWHHVNSAIKALSDQFISREGIRVIHKYLAMSVAVILLTACSETGAIEEAVKAGLKDPDSAKFGEISQAEGPKGKYACATVNARNSMGGYTGDSQMYLLHDETEGWVVVDDLDTITHEKCKENIEIIANNTTEQ